MLKCNAWYALVLYNYKIIDGTPCTQNINKKRDFLAFFLIGKQMIWAITSFNKINVYHTNADKANDDGGHGGDGNWMACGPPTPTVDLKVLVVPCRFLRMTIVWPKLRGKVAAELRGRVVAAEMKCNLTICLSLDLK